MTKSKQLTLVVRQIRINWFFLRLQYLKTSIKIYSFIIGSRTILRNGNPVFIFRNMSIGVIFIVACPILFSCATAQQTQLKSNDAVVHNHRGLDYFQIGQYDRAISDFSKAIEINPRLAHAYNNRGWVYIKKWQYDQAISDFSKTIEIDPRFVEAYFSRAIVYFFVEEHDKSLLDVIKAQQLGYQIPPELLDYLRKAVAGIGV